MKYLIGIGMGVYGTLVYTGNADVVAHFNQATVMTADAIAYAVEFINSFGGAF